MLDSLRAACSIDRQIELDRREREGAEVAIQID